MTLPEVLCQWALRGASSASRPLQASSRPCTGAAMARPATERPPDTPWRLGETAVPRKHPQVPAGPCRSSQGPAGPRRSTTRPAEWILRLRNSSSSVEMNDSKGTLPFYCPVRKMKSKLGRASRGRSALAVGPVGAAGACCCLSLWRGAPAASPRFPRPAALPRAAPSAAPCWSIDAASAWKVGPRGPRTHRVAPRRRCRDASRVPASPRVIVPPPP